MRRILAIATLMLLAPWAAQAACTISSAPLAFSNFTGAALDGSGSFTVNCTKGTAYTVAANLGSNYYGGPANMKGGAVWAELALHPVPGRGANSALGWRRKRVHQDRNPRHSDDQFLRPYRYTDQYFTRNLHRHRQNDRRWLVHRHGLHGCLGDRTRRLRNLCQSAQFRQLYRRSLERDDDAGSDVHVLDALLCESGQWATFEMLLDQPDDRTGRAVAQLPTVSGPSPYQALVEQRQPRRAGGDGHRQPAIPDRLWPDFRGTKPHTGSVQRYRRCQGHLLSLIVGRYTYAVWIGWSGGHVRFQPGALANAADMDACGRRCRLTLR
jgi:Spore Coat Protein U domain